MFITGEYCETKIPFCTKEYNPCRNGARCVDHFTHYTCECVVGYSGENCTINIDDCQNNMCQVWRPTRYDLNAWVYLKMVTSDSPIFVSHYSSAFLWVICLIDFMTKLAAILKSGALVSCHNFLSCCLCFNNQSKKGTSLFMSKSAILLVSNLYAETIEAVKSCVALSVSNPKLFLILCDINSEASL